MGIVAIFIFSCISNNWFNPKSVKRLGELMEAQKEIYHRIQVELSTAGGGTKLWYKIRYGKKTYELFANYNK
jgi:hypothetical protein